MRTNCCPNTDEGERCRQGEEKEDSKLVHKDDGGNWENTRV